MNLRHAAALALMGWYLMVPPFSALNTPDPYAPLNKWRVVHSFETSNECEAD
jgi:hypothetical protein